MSPGFWNRTSRHSARTGRPPFLRQERGTCDGASHRFPSNGRKARRGQSLQVPGGAVAGQGSRPAPGLEKVLPGGSGAFTPSGCGEADWPA